MMNLKTMFLLVVLLFVGSWGYAQRTITGKVTDAKNGEGLISATVTAKGTSIGVVTDIDGKYSINLPAGTSALEVSYVGFDSQTIALGKSNVVDVALIVGKALDEVIVVGYGTQKRKDLTGSITSITAENFVKGPAVTPEQLVSGKIAGVSIISNGGRPGGGSQIRIRGGSSLNASNDPLIVIDGVPVDNGVINGAPNPLSMVNPNDIESVTVLKDASATAIYGSRASNGVILIVTKKGGPEKIKISFSTLLSSSENTKNVSVLTGDEFRKLIEEKGSATQKLLVGTANTNWQNEVFQKALSSDNNLSISGTVAKMPYRVSLGYLDQKGILRNSGLQRTSVGLGLNPSLLDNHLRINVNVKASQAQNQFSDQGAIGGATWFDPTQKTLNDTSQLYGGYWEWMDKKNKNIPFTLAGKNPLGLINQKIDQSEVNRILGNVQFDYKFHFLPDLHANLNVGLDRSKSSGNKATPATAASGFFQGGYVGEYAQSKQNKLLEFYLNYAKDLKSIDSRIDIVGGYSYQDFYKEARGFDRDLNPSRKEPALAVTTPQPPDTTQNTIISFFGRLNYTLKEKYLLTATLRQDGSSRFSPDTRWGLFPSVALAWKVKEEGFLKDVSFLSDLKFRVGYGVTGQQDIGKDYSYLTRYTRSELTAQYQLGNAYYQTLRPEGYDANIKWETTTTYNAALDFGFANSRIIGSIDVYQRNTKDLLAEIAVPAGSNLTNRIITNVGSLENRGIEGTITLVPVKTTNLTWNVNFNATYNQNKITSLTKVEDPKNTGISVGGIAGGVGNNIQNHAVGFARSSFYVYQQVYNSAGKPIEGLYVDKNGDGKITFDDLYRYKSPDAPLFLGFGSSVNYKNISLGFSARANIGNYVYNNFNSNNGAYRNATVFPTSLSNVSTNVLETNFQNNQYFSDYYVENASFLRVDNIYVAYGLQNLFGSKLGARLTASVQNAMVITKYSGRDPELTNGIDDNFYPRPRVIAVGMNVDF